MDSIEERFQRQFGSDAIVVMATMAERRICSFAMCVVPHESAEATEDTAWRQFAAAVQWIHSEEKSLGSPAKAEVIVGIPEAIRAGKRRIFRIAGSLPQLSQIVESQTRSAAGDGSYVVHYKEWSNGLPSTIWA